MKKILALLLALTMVFALCACGQQAAPAATQAAQPAAPAAEPAATEAPAKTEKTVLNLWCIATENGRATRAMAMALKSRAALYAASPLYNTNGDNAKWTEAAKASHDIIASAGELGLGLDTYARTHSPKNHCRAQL